MATVRANLPHEDRTVDEPRHNEIHPVVLSEIEQVNDDIKLFKLSILNKEKGVKVSKSLLAQCVISYILFILTIFVPTSISIISRQKRWTQTRDDYRAY